jgi:hypothetical protein
MKFGECIALCLLTCAISGAATADSTSSPKYTGVSDGKSSTVGSYGTKYVNQGPHETLPHYTPAHFDNQGNFHESHQSYGRYVDPSERSSRGRHRRNR